MIDLTEYNKALQREYRKAQIKRWAWLAAVVIAAYTWAIGYALEKW